MFGLGASGAGSWTGQDGLCGLWGVAFTLCAYTALYFGLVFDCSRCLRVTLPKFSPGSSGCGRRPRCRWPMRNSEQHLASRNARFRHEIVPSIPARHCCQTPIMASPKSRVRRGTPRKSTCSSNSSYVSASGQKPLSAAIDCGRRLGRGRLRHPLGPLEQLPARHGGLFLRRRRYQPDSSDRLHAGDGESVGELSSA